ncbi:MAG: HAD family hydrolase [Candidatus Obscuribacterales bacterium]|nr:HAD family hydrolase [Candidatus Obscuribacterales bacterium]
MDVDSKALASHPAETHGWLSDAAAIAYSAEHKLQQKSWTEIGIGLAVGAATFVAARRLHVNLTPERIAEVAKGVETVTRSSAVADIFPSLAKDVDHFVFDLDSTLIDYYGANRALHQTMFTELRSATGLPDDVIKSALQKTARKLGSNYYYNDLNQIDGIRKYYPNTDLNEKFANVSLSAKTAYHDALKASPETVELFEFLRRNDKKIHVFTASQTARAMDKLSASGLTPYVDQIFTAGPHPFEDLPSSGLITAESPMSRVTELDYDTKETGEGYQFVAYKLKVKPSKILMTGDSLNLDVKPAQRLGMYTAQASWYVQDTSRSIVPDLELTSPKQLQSLLAEAYSPTSQ